ncbi:hypothetical protein M5D96_011908 [Drosophila gunungcola]|uniref:Uncharacterized protein n=1 Tax=Drosophila gunungcola TaxID=103775 RepID=A0A9Q0BKW2_9MUSC|nr:hypothetical protein M5D96_011908 [Drosophila gunungcola]
MEVSKCWAPQLTNRRWGSTFERQLEKTTAIACFQKGWVRLRSCRTLFGPLSIPVSILSSPRSRFNNT